MEKPPNSSGPAHSDVAGGPHFTREAASPDFLGGRLVQTGWLNRFCDVAGWNEGMDRQRPSACQLKMSL
jgi:hypothetical protein